MKQLDVMPSHQGAQVGALIINDSSQSEREGIEGKLSDIESHDANVQISRVNSTSCLDNRDQTANDTKLEKAQQCVSPKCLFKGLLGSVLFGGMLTGTGFATAAIARAYRAKSNVPFAQRPLNIQGCGEDDMQLIIQAHQGISSHLEKILFNPSVDLTPDQESRFIDCFEDTEQSCMTYVCSDDKGSCTKENILGYFSHPSAKYNEIYFCMENLKNYINRAKPNIPNALKCEIQDTMAHECGHYLDLPMADDHDQGPNGDAVYRLGDAAYDACQYN